MERDLARWHLTDPVDASYNGFLINTGAKLVLIDTGLGRLARPATGHRLRNIRASGYQPKDVDEIYITHMHGDHIGGLMLGKERAFPTCAHRRVRLTTG